MFISNGIAAPRHADLQTARVLSVVEVGSIPLVKRSVCAAPVAAQVAFVGSDSELVSLLLSFEGADTNRVVHRGERIVNYGWSASGQQLAYSIVRSNGSAYLLVYDTATGQSRRITRHEDGEENYFTWTGSNSFLFAYRAPKAAAAELFMGRLPSSRRGQEADSLSVPEVRILTSAATTNPLSLGGGEGEEAAGELVPIGYYRPQVEAMSETNAFFVYQGNLQELELKPLKTWKGKLDYKSQTTHPISHWPTKEFDGFKWVRHSRNTGKFLFCALRTNDTWRYAWEFDPATQQVRQMSHTDTYNTQWFNSGKGYCYVANSNNSFSLVIQSFDPPFTTNLFTRGNVVNYSAAAQARRVFVTAGRDAEPECLWCFDMDTRELKVVHPAGGIPWKYCQNSKPVEEAAKAKDGLTIPYFVCHPVKREADKPGWFSWGKKKYPAVIFLPAPTGQFQRSFDAKAQVCANFGAYFIAVNARGSDGYGAAYASMKNEADAAKDVLAVYEQVLARHDIDKDRVFLMTSSGGVGVTTRLTLDEPKKWRGVVMDCPGGFSAHQLMKADRLPPMMVIAGADDPAVGSVRGLERMLKENPRAIQTHVIPKMGHVTFDLAQRKEKLEVMAKFLTEKF